MGFNSGFKGLMIIIIVERVCGIFVRLCNCIHLERALRTCLGNNCIWPFCHARRVRRCLFTSVSQPSYQRAVHYFVNQFSSNFQAVAVWKFCCET